jgi:hypothetical protein
MLSHTFFYMAVPDWDIPLQRATGLRLLIHRSWLFHSVLIPMGLMGVWFWTSLKSAQHQPQRILVNLLRDASIGLSVGMSAHLIWDALLSSTRRGFYIHGFGQPLSLLWLLGNLIIGLGVPLFIAKQLQHESSEPL